MTNLNLEQTIRRKLTSNLTDYPYNPYRRMPFKLEDAVRKNIIDEKAPAEKKDEKKPTQKGKDMKLAPKQSDQSDDDGGKPVEKEGKGKAPGGKKELEKSNVADAKGKGGSKKPTDNQNSQKAGVNQKQKEGPEQRFGDSDGKLAPLKISKDYDPDDPDKVKIGKGNPVDLKPTLNKISPTEKESDTRPVREARITPYTGYFKMGAKRSKPEIWNAMRHHDQKAKKASDALHRHRDQAHWSQSKGMATLHTAAADALKTSLKGHIKARNAATKMKGGKNPYTNESMKPTEVGGTHDGIRAAAALWIKYPFHDKFIKNLVKGKESKPKLGWVADGGKLCREDIAINSYRSRNEGWMYDEDGWTILESDILNEMNCPKCRKSCPKNATKCGHCGCKLKVLKDDMQLTDELICEAMDSKASGLSVAKQHNRKAINYKKKGELKKADMHKRACERHLVRFFKSAAVDQLKKFANIRTESEITINDYPFMVEWAATPEKRELGLMYRDSMPIDHGMLFDFEEEKPLTMWMENTHIPLDMIFISEAGEIVDIATNCKPDCTDYIMSDVPARYVLEVNAGIVFETCIQISNRIDELSTKTLMSYRKKAGTKKEIENSKKNKKYGTNNRRVGSIIAKTKIKRNDIANAKRALGEDTRRSGPELKNAVKHHSDQYYQTQRAYSQHLKASRDDDKLHHVHMAAADAMARKSRGHWKAARVARSLYNFSSKKKVNEQGRYEYSHPKHKEYSLFKHGVTALQDRKTKKVLTGIRGQLHSDLADKHNIDHDNFDEFNPKRTHERGFWHTGENKFVSGQKTALDSRDQMSPEQDKAWKKKTFGEVTVMPMKGENPGLEYQVRRRKKQLTPDQEKKLVSGQVLGATSAGVGMGGGGNMSY